MGLQKGTTNNRKGRPPKERALTALLEATGNRIATDPDGNRTAGKRLVANYIWEALTTGSVLLPTGVSLNFDANEWASLAKWVFAQVDGPPKQAHDITITIQQEVERLATEFGLDPADVMAEAIAILKASRT